MATGPYRPGHGRRRAHRPVNLAGLPTPEELAQQPHKGDAADRFSLYTPEQIAQETRDARLQMTFDDVIKIRDQAEMVIACMQHVIMATRKHDLGSIRQRIEARREVASLVERLTLFNGKTPYGYAKKKRNTE
jgi:hypothetical protein